MSGTYTFQQGVSSYSGARDTHICGFQPTFNRGGNGFVEIGAYTGGTPPGNPSNGLFYWDISGASIPATDNTTSAIITFTYKDKRNGFNSKTFTVRRIVRGLWQEGTGTGVDGQASAAGDVNYTYFSNTGIAWGTAGGVNTSSDISTTFAPTFTINVDVPGTLYTVDIKDIFDLWVKGTASNYGVHVFCSSGDNNNGGLDIYSKEEATSSRRPLLTAITTAGDTTTTQTILGKADIIKSAAQTLLGKSRILKSVTQTITGVSRILKSASQTILGVSRITNSTLKTILGKADIIKSVSQTLNGKSSILKAALQTIQGIANIINQSIQTIPGKSRIQKSVSRTITAISSIILTTSQTLLGKSSITAITTKDLLGKAYIVRTGVLNNPFVYEICEYLAENLPDRFTFSTGSSNLKVGELIRNENGVVAVAVPSLDPDTYTPVRYYQIDFIAKNQNSKIAYQDLRAIFRFFNQAHDYFTDSYEIYFTYVTNQPEDLDRDQEGRKNLRVSILYTVRNLIS